MNNLKQKFNDLLKSDLNKRIFNHSFWILSGNILSKAILLVATILMAKYLNKHEYGQFGIIKSTILMFAMFAGMELGITATKYISQYKITNPAKVEKIVGLSNFFAITISIIISIIVFVFAKEIAQQINAPTLFPEIRISSFILFFSSLNGIQNGILAGLEKFKVISINSAIAGVISSVFMIIASMYGDLELITIAFGSNFVILFLLNFISLKNNFFSEYNIQIFNKSNFDEVHVLWKFSLPAILAGLMVGPVTWYCNYLLVNQINGYQQMANFDIANQWRNTILFIPAALSQIALPLLSSSLENKTEYKSIYIRNIKLNFYIAFFFVIILVIMSPGIIYFYGDKYSDALLPLIIMFITTGLIAINNVIGQAIASQDKMWLGFFVNLLWAIILIICSYVFIVIYQWGAVGISLAYLISYISHTLVQFLYIKRFL